MAIKGGPRIPKDGLVLSLDAANMKSYDKYENLIVGSQLGSTILNQFGVVTLSTDTSIANPFGKYDGILKCTHSSSTPGYFRRGKSLSLVSGSTYTFSYYFKNGDMSNPYNWPNGNYIGTHFYTPSPFAGTTKLLDTNIPVGDGWYRQTHTFTPSYTGTSQVFFNLAVSITPVVGTFYLYGFQLEEGSTVTDYYETTTTAKTRSTTWLDMSGNGYDGTLTNGPTYSTGSLGALSFDGVDDMLEGPFIQPNAGNFTYDTIMEWGSISTSTPIFCTGASTGSGTFAQVFISSTGIAVNLYAPQGYNGGWLYGGYVSTHNFVANQKYHLTIVNEGTVWKYYINGVYKSSYDPGYLLNEAGSQRFGIFRLSVGYAAASKTGKVYNCKIYNRALTADEIKNIYAATRGRFGL